MPFFLSSSSALQLRRPANINLALRALNLGCNRNNTRLPTVSTIQRQQSLSTTSNPSRFIRPFVLRQKFGGGKSFGIFASCSLFQTATTTTDGTIKRSKMTSAYCTVQKGSVDKEDYRLYFREFFFWYFSFIKKNQYFVLCFFVFPRFAINNLEQIDSYVNVISESLSYYW